MVRPDKRESDQLRSVKITRNFTKYAEGSVLIEMGETKVICTASVEERVPHFRKGSGSGWVTAEYSMLPRATQERRHRERGGGGRTAEIQRLVGRSLRAVTDLDALGERTIVIDTDVIQADGGTRTAAITGAFVALHDACTMLLQNGVATKNPLREFVAAISVGIMGGEKMLDLSYAEDFAADVDMNVVMTESGKIVEIQGTAEKTPFSKKDLDELVALAAKGTAELIKRQQRSLGAKS